MTSWLAVEFEDLTNCAIGHPHTRLSWPFYFLDLVNSVVGSIAALSGMMNVMTDVACSRSAKIRVHQDRGLEITF